MRSAAAWTLAAVLAAPAVLALAVPGVDFEALRCAMKCGHAVRAGAVCCPTKADGASWTTCPTGEQGLLAFAAPAAAVLTLSFRLAMPSGSVRLFAAPASSPRSALDPPLDHVPLALS
jgi:hypothetical protein